ncbi:MAG: hypothetical protein K8T89_08975 [Planctomycetes bacterium]|nr:hypothetical protein [Planctomycetota bacterium]
MLGPMADGMQITLSDGRQVWRPMGLSDSPGGAAVSGAFAVMFGLGITVTERNWLLRLIAIAGAGAGMFCVYICQVRSVFLMTVAGVVVYLAIMTIRQRMNRMAFLVLTVPMVLLGAYLWASAVGGTQVVSRLDTLSEQPAFDVYYKNRGIFLEQTLTDLLPEYPLGAGLGRWGMTFSYFGDPDLPDSKPIWVEIQLTGWLLDGGFPLVVIGYMALIFACVITARQAFLAQDPRIADIATAISSLNLSLLMMTFNYPLFISQLGLTFWMLNGLLFASTLSPRRTAVPKPGFVRKPDPV